MGNCVIELGTFIAIILGTVGGAWIGEHFNGHEDYAGYVLLGLSVVGFGTSLGIDKVRAAAPEKPFRFNIVGDLLGGILLFPLNSIDPKKAGGEEQGRHHCGGKPPPVC